MASSAAAGAVVRARRRIVSYFFAMHAVTAGDAVPYLPETTLQRRQFDRMKTRGIIREAEAATYWIDVAAYDEDNRRRRSRIALILAPILIVSILVIAWAAYRR
ncbi:MAG: hypothetical protein WDN44_14610 [Sphingomonas sp.]